MNDQKPCRKCLLRELDETEIIRELQAYIADYPKEKRAEEGEYRRRLAICQRCENLMDGVCRRCGCFVELRALKKGMDCPVKKWSRTVREGECHGFFET